MINVYKLTEQLRRWPCQYSNLEIYRRKRANSGISRTKWGRENHHYLNNRDAPIYPPHQGKATIGGFDVYLDPTD